MVLNDRRESRRMKLKVKTTLGITIANKGLGELHSVEDVIELVSQYVPDEI